MKLAPISRIDNAPKYPARRTGGNRVGTWARRLGRTGAALAALTFASCGSSTLVGGEEPTDGGIVEDSGGDATTVDGGVEPTDGGYLPPVQCEPEYRLSGDYAPIEPGPFRCGVTAPADTPVQELPIHIGAGQLCDGTTAWTHLNVPEAMRIRIASVAGPHVAFELYSPDGDLVAEINGDELCLELDVTAGVWTLAALHTTLPEDPLVFFEYYIDIIEAE